MVSRLSRDEERSLFSAFNDGSVVARNRLIASVTPMAFHLSKKKFAFLNYEDSSDAAQSALLHLVGVLDKFVVSDTACFATWAYSVLRRAIRRYQIRLNKNRMKFYRDLKLKGENGSIEGETILADRRAPATDAIESEELIQSTLKWFQRAVLKLEERQRRVLYSRLAQQKTHAETAEAFDIGVSAAEDAYRNALLKFVKIVKENDAARFEEICDAWLKGGIEGLTLSRARLLDYLQVMKSTNNYDPEFVKQQLAKTHLSFSETVYDKALRDLQEQKESRATINSSLDAC